MVLLLVGILPTQAQAIDLIDLNRTGKLTITSTYNGADGKSVALSGAEFKLYLVATPDEQCNLTPTAAFAPLVKDLNKMDAGLWNALAADLGGRVSAMTPERTGTTNAQGAVVFDNLKLGLYLAVSTPHRQNKLTYQQSPILVMIPNRNMTGEDIDSWHYEVAVTGKPVTAKDALKVIKIWDDKNDAAYKRPKSIVVYLLKDGKVADSVKLDDKNNWQHVWENLEYGPTWSVREETAGLSVINYKPGDPVRDDKGTEYIIWTITNKYAPPPAKLPQTGQLWWPVPVLVSLGLMCLLVALLRRRGERNEA